VTKLSSLTMPAAVCQIGGALDLVTPSSVKPLVIDGTSQRALPRLQKDLHASATDVQWVSRLQLFLSALILVGGSLGDSFWPASHFRERQSHCYGRLRWCGLAPNTLQLIIARRRTALGCLAGSGAFCDPSRHQRRKTWGPIRTVRFHDRHLALGQVWAFAGAVDELAVVSLSTCHWRASFS